MLVKFFKNMFSQTGNNIDTVTKNIQLILCNKELTDEEILKKMSSIHVDVCIDHLGVINHTQLVPYLDCTFFARAFMYTDTYTTNIETELIKPWTTIKNNSHGSIENKLLTRYSFKPDNTLPINQEDIATLFYTLDDIK